MRDAAVVSVFPREGRPVTPKTLVIMDIIVRLEEFYFLPLDIFRKTHQDSGIRKPLER